MKNNRLYVLVRKDLCCSAPYVQAGHVVAKFCLEASDAVQWNNQYLIYLGVNDVHELKRWKFKFTKRGIDTYEFHEPDNELFNDKTLTGCCGLVEEENAGFLSKLDIL